MSSTIIRREQRAVTAVMAEGEERATCAIDPHELQALIQRTDLEPRTGEFETRIPRKLATEPKPPVIVEERPTCAIDPDELKALTRPPVLPIYRGAPARWPWLILVALAGVLGYLLYP